MAVVGILGQSGIRELVMAEKTISIPSANGGGETVDYPVTLTCDFDPLIVAAAGQKWLGYSGGVRARLTADGAWSVMGDNVPSISGKTVSVTFQNQNYGPSTPVFIRAWGLAD